MVWDLARADVRLRWLVTCLLATFGLTYLFGAWMVGLYAGFTPRSIAETYGAPPMAMPMPPDSTMVMEHPMQLSDLGDTETHVVDTPLLVQDTHVHLPMYGIIATALSLVVLGLPLSRGRSLALITLLFSAPWLDFLGMWLTHVRSTHFAVLTLAGGYAMGLGYAIVTLLAVPAMWRRKGRSA